MAKKAKSCAVNCSGCITGSTDLGAAAVHLDPLAGVDLDRAPAVGMRRHRAAATVGAASGRTIAPMAKIEGANRRPASALGRRLRRSHPAPIPPSLDRPELVHLLIAGPVLPLVAAAGQEPVET